MLKGDGRDGLTPFFAFLVTYWLKTIFIHKKTMRNFTKEELAQLEALATSNGKMESRFKTAMGPNRDGRNGYIRGLSSRDAEAIFKIYKDATGTTMRFYPNCGACVLKALKLIAPKYYADLAALEAENQATNTDIPTAPKKPRKRAKK